jgi:hypothetical protein
VVRVLRRGRNGGVIHHGNRVRRVAVAADHCAMLLSGEAMKFTLNNPIRFVAIVIGAAMYFILGDASLGFAFLIGAFVGSVALEKRTDDPEPLIRRAGRALGKDEK